jgi:molybdopterin-binding protein
MGVSPVETGSCYVPVAKSKSQVSPDLRPPAPPPKIKNADCARRRCWEGKVQLVGLITGVCSVQMWLLRSSDQKVAQGAVALGAVLGIRTDETILARNLPRGLSVRYALQGTIREIGNVDGKQLLYIDVRRRLSAKTTLDVVEKLGLEVGDEVYCLSRRTQPVSTRHQHLYLPKYRTVWTSFSANKSHARSFAKRAYL